MLNYSQFTWDQYTAIHTHTHIYSICTHGHLVSFPGLPGSSLDRLQYAKLQTTKNWSQGKPEIEATATILSTHCMTTPH